MNRQSVSTVLTLGCEIHGTLSFWRLAYKPSLAGGPPHPQHPEKIPSHGITLVAYRYHRGRIVKPLWKRSALGAGALSLSGNSGKLDSRSRKNNTIAATKLLHSVFPLTNGSGLIFFSAAAAASRIVLCSSPKQLERAGIACGAFEPTPPNAAIAPRRTFWFRFVSAEMSGSTASEPMAANARAASSEISSSASKSINAGTAGLASGPSSENPKKAEVRSAS